MRLSHPTLKITVCVNRPLRTGGCRQFRLLEEGHFGLVLDAGLGQGLAGRQEDVDVLVDDRVARLGPVSEELNLECVLVSLTLAGDFQNIVRKNWHFVEKQC
jgi:hypothetical protein